MHSTIYIYIYMGILDLHMAPYAACEVVQSTVRSGEATLKGILKVFLKVCLKVQPSKAQPICVFEGSAEQSLADLCF